MAKADPTKPILERAKKYDGAVQGTSCTQVSFKVGKKAFLFIGEQGGRFKAMFKLERSLEEARKMSAENPDDFQVGSNGWVTARFSKDDPLPKSLWTKWLDESYQLGTAKKPTS